MADQRALAAAVREIESHVAQSGWDQPARLFALVETADLLAREPDLADRLGADDGLTPVEQELELGRPLEDLLAQIAWPEQVSGCAAVIERLVLPPVGDGRLPTDSLAAQELAREHPDRQEVRLVAGALRGGSTYCALRLRTHDDEQSVLAGEDLVPALLELLSETLEEQ
jgi:hypothetical protein